MRLRNYTEFAMKMTKEYYSRLEIPPPNYKLKPSAPREFERVLLPNRAEAVAHEYVDDMGNKHQTITLPGFPSQSYFSLG